MKKKSRELIKPTYDKFFFNGSIFKVAKYWIINNEVSSFI